MRSAFGIALVATAVAGALAGGRAWGHSFPPLRTVVLQVERCELIAMVGYRAASGVDTELLVARAASQPKSQALDTLRDVLANQALSPLTLSVDGAPLVPTTVRAKLGSEGPGGRPMVVLLISYPLPAGRELALVTRDPRRTRISWTDRDSRRIELAAAPGQGRWFDGVASFLLHLAPGGPPCVARSPRSQPLLPSPPPR